MGVMRLDAALCVQANRHLRRGQGRAGDDGRLRGLHGEVAAADRHLERARLRPTGPGAAGLRAGLDFGWYYRGDGYRYRFSEEGHLDLCDVISDHGAAKMTSLDGAARTIGLPGKDGVDGSQVEGLWNAGELDSLRRYCLCDVAQTAFLFLRYRLRHRRPRTGPGYLPGGHRDAGGHGDRRPLRPPHRGCRSPPVVAR